MPFLSYATVDEALENAGRFLREAGAEAVKIEGGVRSARIVEALVRAGIPVMGHIGWTPQSQHGLGGKVRVQGKSRETARALLADAIAIQEAGAFAIVLELVPEQLAAIITSRLRIPTIGIGAGAGCSGQVQVDHRPPRASGTSSRATRGPTPTSGRRSGRPSRPGPPTSPPARSRARPRASAWTRRSSTRPSGEPPTIGRATMADGLPSGIPLDRDL